MLFMLQCCDVLCVVCYTVVMYYVLYVAVLGCILCRMLQCYDVFCVIFCSVVMYYVVYVAVS